MIILMICKALALKERSALLRPSTYRFWKRQNLTIPGPAEFSGLYKVIHLHFCLTIVAVFF